MPIQPLSIVDKIEKINPNPKLFDRHVIITGSSKGVGLCMVVECVRRSIEGFGRILTEIG